jgi:hypothetical protein
MDIAADGSRMDCVWNISRIRVQIVSCDSLRHDYFGYNVLFYAEKNPQHTRQQENNAVLFEYCCKNAAVVGADSVCDTQRPNKQSVFYNHIFCVLRFFNDIRNTLFY